MQRRIAYCAAVLALIVLIGLPRLAHAQAASSPPPPPPEQEGSAEFAFVGTTGNSSTQTVALKLSNTIRYVNLAVLGFKNTDAVTSIALVAKF